MNVTFACPHCEAAARVEVNSADRSITCPHCRQMLEFPADAYEAGRLRRCLVCPSADLYVRKDFPQRLGVAIVVLGFAVSCVTWYLYWIYLTFAVLFATALVDVLLYLLMGDAVQCYRCGANYRDLEHMEDHAAFDLETHERHRQQQARLAQRPAPNPGQEREPLQSKN